MKRIKYIYTVSLLATLFMISGCQEFLDRYPTTSVSGKDIFSSLETAEAGLIGLYDDLQDSRLTGRNSLMRGDLKGSDVFLLTGGGQYFVTEYNYRDNVTNIGRAGYIWAGGYEMIKNCNVFLEGIEDVEGDADKINDMIAQAEAIKAVAYIELVKTFCYPPRMAQMDDKYSQGVPIVRTKEDNVSAIVEGPRRAPLGDVFDHIEELLLDARDKIDVSRSTGFYVSKYAISGLLAEIYTYQERWTDAIAAAEAAAEGGSMIDHDDYLDTYLTDNSPETIFDIVYTLTDNLSDGMPGYWFNKTVNEDNRQDAYTNGYGDGAVSDAFMDLLNENPNDIRLQLLHEDKMSTAPADLEPPYVHGVDGFSSRYYYKFIGGKDGNVYLHNTPIIRIPEVLLIAAEAYSELDQDGPALNYLNMVYSKRTNTTLTGLTGQDLKDEIFNERRRELVLEGHNIWDYLRKNRSFTRDDSHFTIVTIDPTTEAGRNNEFFYKVVAPIPITEMDANPNIRDQQNPGYAGYQGSDSN